MGRGAAPAPAPGLAHPWDPMEGLGTAQLFLCGKAGRVVHGWLVLAAGQQEEAMGGRQEMVCRAEPAGQGQNPGLVNN